MQQKNMMRILRIAFRNDSQKISFHLARILPGAQSCPKREP